MPADSKSDSPQNTTRGATLAPAPAVASAGAAKRSTTTYPYYGIEESLKVARAVAKLGTKDVRDEDIAKELDREQTSRFFSYYTSSAREFGLIARTGRGESMRTSLTDLGRRAITRIDDATTRATMMSVFLTPALYKSIADAYAGMTLPDVKGLANLLSIQHGIVDGVKDQAAQAFIDSASFAGFLRDGTLSVEQAVMGAVAAAKPLAPPPPPPPAMGDESTTVTLPSGATVTLSISSSVIKLPKGERNFVLSVIDMLEGYEGEAPTGGNGT